MKKKLNNRLNANHNLWLQIRCKKLSFGSAKLKKLEADCLAKKNIKEFQHFRIGRWQSVQHKLVP